jgi:RNA polymerase sigma factor (sigma-70 family)
LYRWGESWIIGWSSIPFSGTNDQSMPREPQAMENEAKLLVEQWRQGDQDAASKLYAQYFERLMRIVSGQLLQSYQQQVEPEDVLQSAFGTVFKRISNGDFRFENDQDVWKLLVTVTLNKVRGRIRFLNAERRDIRRTRRGETDFDLVLAEQLSKNPGVQEAVEFADLVRDIYGLLPEDETQVLQLRIEGYSQQEIADKLGVTDRTVRRMWDRIRQRLARLLGGEEV